MRYNPTAEYVPGKELVIADTLSRHPQADETQEVALLANEIQAYKNAIHTAWPISPTKLNLIKEQTLEDAELRMVQHYVMTGWPKYAVKVPDKVKAYYTSRHCLTTSKGLILYNDRIVVPHKMRSEILQRIHDDHLVIVKGREHARCSVWWPKISADIQEIVSTCKHCQESRPSQKSEPLITTPLPSRPWEKVAADM